MCKLAIHNGQVDLDSCPLLAGLSPEERRRKAQDPRLKACMARATSKADEADDCLVLTGDAVRASDRSLRRSAGGAQLAS
jgi:hypothetical protein